MDDEARRQERLRYLNDPERIARIPEFPEPKRRETDDQYRERIRQWCDAIPMEENETEGFRQSQFAYLCWLQGVPID